VGVLRFAHADGRYTQTKKARVASNQLRLDRCQIEEIGMDNFT
jgi:hypothetical protein